MPLGITLVFKTNHERSNHAKPIDLVMITSLGDRDLEIIDNNAKFELYEPDYLLDPWLIAQNYRQVSINNALSANLIGQINSESIFGGQMYNGIGGQSETHSGALYSRAGRAIILLY